MGNHSGAIAGHGKVCGINQAEPDRWEDCKQEENFLQRGFWVIGGGEAVFNLFYDICCGKGAVIVICEFAVDLN